MVSRNFDAERASLEGTDFTVAGETFDVDPKPNGWLHVRFVQAMAAYRKAEEITPHTASLLQYEARVDFLCGEDPEVIAAIAETHAQWILDGTDDDAKKPRGREPITKGNHHGWPGALLDDSKPRFREMWNDGLIGKQELEAIVDWVIESTGGATPGKSGGSTKRSPKKSGGPKPKPKR